MPSNDHNPTWRLAKTQMELAIARQTFDEQFLTRWRTRLAHLERGGDSLHSAVAEELILMPAVPGLTRGHP